MSGDILLIPSIVEAAQYFKADIVPDIECLNNEWRSLPDIKELGQGNHANHAIFQNSRNCNASGNVKT